MYYSEQTLRLKGTTKVYRLVVEDDYDSQWYWEYDTIVIDEKGVEHCEFSLSDFEPVYDEFERPIGDGTDKGEYVSKKCKEYAKYSKAELKALGETSCKKAIRNIFKDMRKYGAVSYPFSVNVEQCYFLKRAFIKQVNAKPLFDYTVQKVDNSNLFDHGTEYVYRTEVVSKILTFTRNKKKYLINDRCIMLIDNDSTLPREQF